MRFWRLAGKTLNTVLDGVLCGAFATMILLICLEVFLRNWRGASLAWYDEVGRLLLVWCTFLGAAVATRNKAHYVIDLFDLGVSRLMKGAIRRISGVVIASVALVFIFEGLELVRSEANQHLPVTGLSFAWLDAPLVVGSVLICIYSIGNLIATFRPTDESYHETEIAS